MRVITAKMRCIICRSFKAYMSSQKTFLYIDFYLLLLQS